MISEADYFNNKVGSPEVTDAVECNAAKLLMRVNRLIWDYFKATGREVVVSPKTRTCVSGNLNGDGGFRLSGSTTGASKSSHKEGKGVDIFDPKGELDSWITDGVLAQHELYREAPASTVGWVHLTTRAPGSGKRTFNP